MYALKRIYNCFLLIPLCLFLAVTAACKSTGGSETVSLYFEPPDRLIDDYAGMVQTDEVNWVWTQVGFRLSNYTSLSLKPFQLFIDAPDRDISSKLDEGFSSWFKETGISLADSGAAIVCEGAVVKAKLERKFFEKINLFDDGNKDFFLEVEVVIKETATDATVCKMRHGALGADVALLQERLLSEITAYLSAYL